MFNSKEKQKKNAANTEVVVKFQGWDSANFFKTVSNDYTAHFTVYRQILRNSVS